MSQDTATVINAAFDTTGVKFHDRATALEEFKQNGREIAIAEDGSATTHYDGETLSLTDALLRFGYDRRELVDGRTLPRQGAGAARPGIDHKGNYHTIGDRVKYIRDNGLKAWEALPRSGASSHEVETKQDWYVLPRAEKIRRLRADENAFVKLPNRPAVTEEKATPQTQKTAGAYINHVGLNKLKQLRGGR